MLRCGYSVKLRGNVEGESDGWYLNALVNIGVNGQRQVLEERGGGFDWLDVEKFHLSGRRLIRKEGAWGNDVCNQL